MWPVCKICDLFAVQRFLVLPSISRTSLHCSEKDSLSQCDIQYWLAESMQTFAWQKDLPFAGALLVSAEDMPHPLKIQLPAVDSQMVPHRVRKDAKAPARPKIQISLCAESVSGMQASLFCYPIIQRSKSISKQLPFSLVRGLMKKMSKATFLSSGLHSPFQISAIHSWALKAISFSWLKPR